MTKEGYQPIKTKKTTKIILPNTGSHVQMKKDGYTWEDLDRSYWEGFDSAKNKMEKRIEELEEKISILLSCKNCPENKGGLLCQKEYEDKCLSQKIQYIKELKEEIAELEKELEQAKKVQVVEHFEAYGQCRDSRRIASLEKENTELKERNGKLAGQNASLNRWLGEAITFIKDYMIITIGDHTTVCSVPEENRCINVLKLNERAKSFLKEFE